MLLLSYSRAFIEETIKETELYQLIVSEWEM